MDEGEEMPGVTGEVVVMVLDYLRENSNPYSDIEDNYVSNIASELGITRQRTHRAVRLLADYNLVRRKRKGQKKIILLNDFTPAEERADPIWQ